MTDHDPHQPVPHGEPAPDRDAPTQVTPPANPTWEPVASGAPVSPVEGAPPRRSGLRLGIALAVAVAVVAVSLAGAFLLTNRTSAGSTLSHWAPSNSVFYAELRLDLPGDQHQKLASFLSHFPGFADQSIFDQKLTEAYDRLLRQATNGKHDYSTEIKPWFTGETAFSVGPFGSAQGSPTMFGSPRVLATATVSSAAPALAWAKGLLDESKAPYSTEQYKGTEILTGGTGDSKAGLAVPGTVMLIGDLASIKAAIDGNGAGGLGDSDAFRAAASTLNGNHLSVMYVDVKAYMAGLTQAMSQFSSFDPYAGMTDLFPEWFAGSLTADSDALIASARVPHNTKFGPQANIESSLASHIPSTTVALLDYGDFGGQIKQALDLYRQQPLFKDAMGQLDKGIGALGGWDGVIGWMGETAIVIDRDGSSISGGVVIAPKDRAAADRLGIQVKNLLALGGGQVGATTKESSYNGATITTIDLGDLARLTGGASGLPTGHAEISFAITDQVVVIGAGEAFVKRILDTKADTSLASNDRFKRLVDRTSKSAASRVWLDLTATRELIEGLLPAEAKTKYEQDMKPYLVPFDAVFATTKVGTDIDESSMYLTVK